jgi:PAS domain S-box-containing protein
MSLSKEQCDIFESISDGYISLDNAFFVLYFNKAAEKMLRRNREDVIGKNLFDAFPEAKGSVIEQKFSEALKTKKQIFFETFFEVPPYINWYDMRIYPSDKGISVYFLVITEQKQADELLLESMLKYQNLVESTTDWVWEVDEAGRYTYVSPRIKDLLGYEPEEIMHKTPFDLMPPEEAKRIKEVFITAVTQQEPIHSLENINLHKDGHPVVLETSGTPIFDTKGIFCGYRGIDRNITKRKEAENKLLEQTKKLEETNIALRVILRESEITKDELEKNVLSNIKGLLLPYLTELNSRLIDEDQQFLMDIIMANINEITSLFTRKLKLEFKDLTPKEIQIADLIKQGRTNKEIAKLLNITTSGVVHHRRNLRKKFNIKGKKINLRSHLLNM